MFSNNILRRNRFCLFVVITFVFGFFCLLNLQGHNQRNGMALTEMEHIDTKRLNVYCFIISYFKVLY